MLPTILPTHQKRVVNHQHKGTKKITQQSNQVVRNINNSLITTFGFTVDSTCSAPANAVQQLGSMPTWLYFARPHNMAFHNLTTRPTEVPAGIQSLLGLGLNFCPIPTTTPKNINESLAQFSRDASTKFFWAGSPPLAVTDLFICSKWEPDPDEIPAEFRARLSAFTRALKPMFRQQRSHQNLLPTQLTAMASLRQDDKLLIFKTDKNLGPAILEQSNYIKMALQDHLHDTCTYRQLSTQQAVGRLHAVSHLIKYFIQVHCAKGSSDAKFLFQ